MLVLTEAAAEVVKPVTSTPQASGRAGLRIVPSAPEPRDAGALKVGVAAGPGENDQVIEAAGARVFLEPQAAAFLEDKVLDAQIDEQGKAQFLAGRPGLRPGLGNEAAAGRVRCEPGGRLGRPPSVRDE